MEYIIDNPRADQVFKQIIRALPAMQNGIITESMESRGIKYEKNWGVPVVDLKEYARSIEKDHLLALKLWNKKWRETMILATLLDEPKKVSEEQMDYWVKTAETVELIEQATMNLFHLTPFAFAKALEWCRGKKYQVKYAGLMLMGRLALTAKNAIDEMFEPFFEVLLPLAKDPALGAAVFRSVCQLARRSDPLYSLMRLFADEIRNSENENAIKLGNELINEFDGGEYPRKS